MKMAEISDLSKHDIYIDCIAKKLQQMLVEKTEKFGEQRSSAKALKEKLKIAEHTNQKVQDGIENMKENVKQHERKLEQLCSEASKIKDLHKCENAMYFSVSKIKWDLNSSSDEIRGFIVSDQPTTFQLDPSKHSKFFISNHLWSLISESKKM